jgi:hypothetical protein
LITLVDEAGGDFDRALKNVEDWYDGAMDRVSGWYKRHVQWILLGIGFLTAIFINADSINIAKALFQDKTLRDAIVANSGEFLRTHDENGVPTSDGANANAAKTNSAGAGTANSNVANSNNSNASNSNANSANANANATNTNTRRARATGVGVANDNAANANVGGSTAANTNGARSNGENSNSANTNSAGGAKEKGDKKPTPLEEARKQLFDLGLPLGWAFDKSVTQDPLRGFPHRGDGGWNLVGWLGLKLFGLFLTGLAISQGAPFWFDVLNKFMVIRSTVKPKEKSPDEGSKD